MFGIGHWEILLILIILVVFFVVVAAVVTFLFRTFSKSRNTRPLNSQSERLKELQKMKDNGLITEDQFNKKREEILSNL